MQRQRPQEKYLRQIDFVFYHERELREAIVETRLGARTEGVIKTKNSNRITNPTATQAVKNLSPLNAVNLRNGEIVKYPERWIIVIDKTYEWCRKQKGQFLEIAKRRYAREDYRKTCRELSITHPTISNTMRLVRMYAALQAVQQGLIEV